MRFKADTFVLQVVEKTIKSFQQMTTNSETKGPIYVVTPKS